MGDGFHVYIDGDVVAVVHNALPPRTVNRARFYQRDSVGNWALENEYERRSGGGYYADGALVSCEFEGENRWIRLLDPQGNVQDIPLPGPIRQSSWCINVDRKDGLTAVSGSEGTFLVEGNRFRERLGSGAGSAHINGDRILQVDGLTNLAIIYEFEEGSWSQAFVYEAPRGTVLGASDIEGDYAVLSVSGAATPVFREEGRWVARARSKQGSLNPLKLRGGKVFMDERIQVVVDGERITVGSVEQLSYGPVLESGEPCGAFENFCRSKICADGVCCTSSCLSSCEACDVAGYVGLCEVIPAGPPRGERAPCGGAGTVCAGVCDGEDTECVYPGAEVACSSGACESGVSLMASVCDGAGACTEAAMEACSPYTCDASGLMCLGACTQSSDCSEGFLCVSGRCESPQSGCQSNADCAAGFICGAGGTCEQEASPPAGGPENGGSSSSCTAVRLASIDGALLGLFVFWGFISRRGTPNDSLHS